MSLNFEGNYTQIQFSQFQKCQFYTSDQKSLNFFESITKAFIHIVSMKKKYDKDDRVYSRFKKHGEKHFYVRCTAEQPREGGPPYVCHFIQSEDYFRNKLHDNIMHKCSFRARFAPTGDLLGLENFELQPRSPKSLLLPDIAVFSSKANVSVQATCD
jgi:hypothetical protein